MENFSELIIDILGGKQLMNGSIPSQRTSNVVL